MSKNLKKYIFLIFIFVSFVLPAFSIEEVVLDHENNLKLNLDYLSDVYYGRVENKEDVSPVLKLFSKDGLEFENSKINSVKATFLFGQNMHYEHDQRLGQAFQYSLPVVEPMVTVKFNDNKSKFMIDYNITRNLKGYSNEFTSRFSQLYVSHDVTPNQTILLGQGGRLPSSYDGSRSVMGQEMVLRSQLGRTFGNRRSVGIRNLAKYKYLDYDIGLYDSTQYMKDFGNGLDFTGGVVLKPFGISEESAKNIRLGAGYSNGHNNISYNMYSVWAAYDYKKFHIHTEYANSDGYNAVKESANKADGIYSFVSYDLTPKIQLVGRFDNFVSDRKKCNSYTNEYTAGVTYFPFKNMKLMLNYVKRVNSDTSDSDMILFATRFII